LRQRGFDFVAQINVHAGGGVSFLFHARKLNRQTAGRARKFHGGKLLLKISDLLPEHDSLRFLSWKIQSVLTAGKRI
jgi:hypothetical protein